MGETWEQTKARYKKKGAIVDEPIQRPSKPRYERSESDELRFNLRRTVLPGVKVDWLVVNATRADITWWLDHKHRFKKVRSPIDGIDPVELLEVLPVNATNEERSPYYNKRPVIIDESLS